MAILRALRGGNPGQQFTLEAAEAVLGRHPECDIVLEAPAVSRQHAKVAQVDGAYFLEDLGSRNGTYLNGRLLTNRQPLSENDQIQICDLMFVFHQGPASAAATIARPADPDSEPVMVDDEQSSNSQIMSKLDVSSGSTGLKLEVNAEAKLKALIEIGQSLGRAVGLDGVLNKLLDSLFTIFGQADRGFVVLKDHATGRLIPKGFRLRRPNDSQPMRISRTIVNSVISSKEAILSADAVNDARFDLSESILDFHIRSIMCVPLVSSDGRGLGAIQIDTLDQRSRFSREDLEVLVSVAYQAAFAVENAQLHETALRDRAIERELAVAHQVQQGFLPAAAPRVPGYDFFEFYEPANKLGGDYFDYVALPADRLAIVVADVSGKGIAASLLMARLSAETRFCLVSEPDLASATGKLNQIFCDSSWEDRFVTFVGIVLDPRRHELTVVNAGHMAPLLRRIDGKIEALGEESAQMPLGVDSESQYIEQRYPVANGDSLVLYTDGITEAMNDSGELYGRQRLWQQLAGEAKGVRHLGLRILDDVKQFVGNRAQSDDMCLTCFGRLA